MVFPQSVFSDVILDLLSEQNICYTDYIDIVFQEYVFFVVL